MEDREGEGEREGEGGSNLKVTGGGGSHSACSLVVNLCTKHTCSELDGSARALHRNCSTLGKFQAAPATSDS